MSLDSQGFDSGRCFTARGGIPGSTGNFQGFSASEILGLWCLSMWYKQYIVILQYSSITLLYDIMLYHII